MFGKIFARTPGCDSALEIGANIGGNLHAIRALLPKAELSAVEINETAAEQLKAIDGLRLYRQSVLQFTPDYQRDFVLRAGLLIHINPDFLPQVYDTLYASHRRYVCIVEYYNPVPVQVGYRGHRNRLFKRDFAGEMLDRFSDLRLLDYGFVYHRGPFPLDDVNWFVLEKQGGDRPA